MKNRRVIFFLLLAIAALAAVETALGRRGVKPTAAALTLVDTDSPVSEVTIERRGEGVIRLKKDARWRLVEPCRAAANEPTVLKLLDALAQIAVTDRISDSELAKVGKDRSDFSLAEPHLKVTLGTADGAKLVIAFGVPTPTDDGVYAAVEGVEAVFITPSSVFEAVDVPVEALRRRALFALGAESVREFGVRSGEQPAVTFVRDGEAWRCGDRPAAAANLKEYLETLTAAQAQSFVWPVGGTNEAEHASAALLSGYGLETESAVTVTLKGADGAERRIVFGKETADGTVYALVQNGAAVVTVPAELKSGAVQNQVRFIDSRLFPVESAAVAAITIMDGDTVCTLSRSDKDGWRLEAPVMAPADAEAVEAMLARLVKLTTDDLDQAGLSVSVAADREPVRIARSALLPTGGLEALRSRTVLKIDSALLRRLVRTPAAKDGEAVSVVYSRERKGWNVEKPEGRGEVAAEAVAAVVNALAELKAMRVEKLKVLASDLDDYGLDDPFLTLAVDQEREGAVRRNLLIGKKTEGGRYVTVGSTDAIFTVADEVLEKLLLPLVSFR